MAYAATWRGVLRYLILLRDMGMELRARRPYPPTPYPLPSYALSPTLLRPTLLRAGYAFSHTEIAYDPMNYSPPTLLRPICLRAPYALSGTGDNPTLTRMYLRIWSYAAHGTKLGHVPTLHTVLKCAMLVRVWRSRTTRRAPSATTSAPQGPYAATICCYSVLCTHLAYAATDAATECFVLTSHMLLPSASYRPTIYCYGVRGTDLPYTATECVVLTYHILLRGAWY
eukprot:35729-Rhodomonas_salina.1